jgi:hypothetical protein
MPQLTAALMRKLAEDLAPVLRFSDLEKYFPVRAESWLTHVTSAPWANDPDDVAALAPDPARHGTAICSSDPDVTPPSITHVAGPPNAADTPLQLTDDANPESIGNPAYQGPVVPERELFLTFGGWSAPDNPSAGGNLDYVYEAFSELSSAMNHKQDWTPLAGRPNRPHFAIPQPPSPAAYCEFEWAGIHPRNSNENGLGDFPSPSVPQLDDFLQVTYYMLFSGREPLAGQPNVPDQEGQWAALSLFLPARIGEQKGRDGRPLQIDVLESDATKGVQGWAVFSVDANDFMAPTSTVERLPVGVELFQGHVFAYVGAGSHRLFPHATPEVVLGPPDQWPDITYEPGSDLEGFLTFVVIGALAGAVGGAIAGGVGGAVVGGVLAGAAVGGVVGAVAGAVIALILWALFELLSELWKNDASPADIPPTHDSPVDPGSSSGDPAFGGQSDPTPGDPTQAPPAGASGEVGGGAAAGAFWPTNEGSADGWDTAYTDIKPISRFIEIAAEDPELQPPPWWGYSGRWGIKVPPAPTPDWISGSRRTDAVGRSWAYWHAHALLDNLVRSAPAPTGP